jgi:hypothetical protein
MGEFNVLNYISESKINEIVNFIGNKPLTRSSHGYSDHGNIKIIDSSKKSTRDYTALSRRKPALGLIEVVLSANRNYNAVVEPNVRRLDKENFKDFNELGDLLKSNSKESFYSFWGPKDPKKYATLCSIIDVIPKLREKFGETKDDFILMNSWAKNAALTNIKNDIIGSLPNIGIATYQHLKMVFGVETVKPDQRVKEVLEYEFGIDKLNDLKSILAVEQIASIVNLNILTVDQIFVKYGSGYYNRVNTKLSLKRIAKQLKENKVDTQIISDVLNLSKHQIDKL